MAYLDTAATAGADLGLGVVILVAGRWMRHAAIRRGAVVVLALLSLELLFIAALSATFALTGEESPIWVACVVWPFQAVLRFIHLPSLVALGGDEIIETIGLPLATAAAMGDILLWGVLAGLWRWRSVGKMRGEQSAAPDAPTTARG